MVTAEQLLFSYRWGADTLRRLVSDVDDERMTEQPAPGINHPAWLVGHVSIYNDVIAALIGGEDFDNPWEQPCGKNSSPSPDRGAYPSKSVIIERFDEGFERATTALSGAPNAAWDTPMTHPTWGKQFSTVAPAITFLATTHLALHVGQLSGWRRAAGLPRI